MKRRLSRNILLFGVFLLEAGRFASCESHDLLRGTAIIAEGNASNETSRRNESLNSVSTATSSSSDESFLNDDSSIADSLLVGVELQEERMLALGTNLRRQMRKNTKKKGKGKKNKPGGNNKKNNGNVMGGGNGNKGKGGGGKNNGNKNNGKKNNGNKNKGNKNNGNMGGGGGGAGAGRGSCSPEDQKKCCGRYRKPDFNSFCKSLRCKTNRCDRYRDASAYRDGIGM